MIHARGLPCPTRIDHFMVVLVAAAFPAFCLGQELDESDSGQPLATREFEALRRQYEAKRSDFFQEYANADSDEARAAAVSQLDPANTFIEPFFDLEQTHRGTIAGLSALYHCIANGASSDRDSPASKARQAAIRLVIAHYAKRPDLDYVIRAVGETTPVEQRLLELAEQHPEPSVRAMALMGKANRRYDEWRYLGEADSWIALLSQQAAEHRSELDRFLKSRARWKHVDPSASHAAALEAIQQILNEYSEILVAPLVPRTPFLLSNERPRIDPLTVQTRRSFGEVAKSLRFELTRLTVGSVAPDIAGRDVFNHEQSLSKHRGKVVVLMFSFKGCGPCERMYPGNRELIKQYDGRPFAVFGVAGDDTVETVKQAATDGTITWPVLWDGGIGGPIAKKWNVRGWPDITVIDHQGIIRYRGIRGAALAIAVGDLVLEAEQSDH